MSWLDTTDWAATLRNLGVSLTAADSLLARVVGAGTVLSGSLDGKRLEVAIGQLGGTSALVTIQVPLDPPLDVGLSIEPEGVLPRSTQRTGNDTFDGLYSVVADEPERASALLAPPILSALVQLLRRSIEVSVRDDVVRVSGESEGWLRMALPLAVEVAHRIDDGRDRLRVPERLVAHRAALGRFASDHLLRIDDSPIRVAGTTDHIRVQAVLHRERHLHYALRATLLLDDALNLDLCLAPATLLTPLRALLPGQKDHRLGDRALDDAFHIRTSAPDTLARALDPESRRALVACGAAARSFLLDDTGVTLELVTRPDAAHEPAEHLRACLGLLGRVSRGVRAVPASPPAGPFR